MHFGHQVSKRHPKMQPYIFGARKGIHIIDLEATQKKLEEAVEKAGKLASDGKTILFVGTKKQIAPIIKKYAEESGMPYIISRWLGGTLTNFFSILGLVKKYKSLTEQLGKGELGKYTKKEQGMIKKDLEKTKTFVEGLVGLNKMPDALFIADLKKDATAFMEARHKKIPIIAICDTNVNPVNVDYLIPANDDSVGSVELVVSSLAGAIKEGKATVPKKEEKK